MYVVRDIFKARAGKAKELVAKFKSTTPHFEAEGIKKIRIMTDAVGEFWTVVWEFEVEEIGDYFEMSDRIYSDERVYTILEGYQEYVLEGRREILKVE